MGVDLNAFIKIYNLFDNKVTVNVFGDTGQPDFTTETKVFHMIQTDQIR